MDDRAWMALGAGFYALAMVVALRTVFARRQQPVRAITLPILLVGFALQTVGLHMRGMASQSCPVGNPFEVLQFVSWSTMLVYFLTGTLFRTTLLGTFCASLAVLLNVVSLILPGADAMRRTGLFGGNPWIEAHASLALFSYGVFGLLAMTSTMYLLQHYGLKRKRFEGLFRFLPPILHLDQLNRRLVTIGASVFTVSVLIGWVDWVTHLETVSPFKLLTTLALWFGYLAVTLARWRGWLRGNRFAWVSVALFLTALLVLWPVEHNRPDEPAAARMIAR